MNGKARIYRRSKWVQDEFHNWIRIPFWRIRHASGAFEEATGSGEAFTRAYLKTQEFYQNDRTNLIIHPLGWIPV